MDRKEWKYINWQNKRTNDKSAIIIIGPNERINLSEIKGRSE